ncbi:MAG: hypothetical protein GC171_03695 [Terrimonas sp.]|nr:hypothetical protein [Terrimonas sp.]
MTLIRIITVSIITNLLLLAGTTGAFAQFKLKGTVYDSTRLYPLESVTVLTSSGNGTVTNSAGKYEISVTEKDSVWFSYLGKPTVKYPVATIANETQFDIAIQITVPYLKEIRLKQRNYKFDSLQNRLDYAKIFDYEKAKLRPNVSNSGVGFDVNEIIRMFQFRKNRNMLAYQRRIIEDEQDDYVSHRFNRGLIIRLTGLAGSELDTFMRIYRPSYEYTLASSEYNFQLYIKKAYENFRYTRKNGEMKKVEKSFLP